MFNFIKRLYDSGIWDIEKVNRSVMAGFITQEQADIILG